MMDVADLSAEQMEIKRLKKVFKNVELESNSTVGVILIAMYLPMFQMSNSF